MKKIIVFIVIILVSGYFIIYNEGEKTVGDSGRTTVFSGHLFNNVKNIWKKVWPKTNQVSLVNEKQLSENSVYKQFFKDNIQKEIIYPLGKDIIQVVRESSNPQLIISKGNEVIEKLVECWKKNRCHENDEKIFPENTTAHRTILQTIDVMKYSIDVGINSFDQMNDEMLNELIELDNIKIQTMAVQLVLDYGSDQQKKMVADSFNSFQGPKSIRFLKLIEREEFWVDTVQNLVSAGGHETKFHVAARLEQSRVSKKKMIMALKVFCGADKKNDTESNRRISNRVNSIAQAIGTSMNSICK